MKESTADTRWQPVSDLAARLQELRALVKQVAAGDSEQLEHARLLRRATLCVSCHNHRCCC